jgi:hypothetical protein
MTTTRVTDRHYHPANGELVREIEVEITRPDPDPDPEPAPRTARVRLAPVITLRPVNGCRPGCTVCAALAEERERTLAAARSYGFQVRYTPPGSPADAVRRTFC